MIASYRDAAQTLVTVTLAAGEVLNGEAGPGTWQLGPGPSAAYVASGASIAAYSPPAAAMPDISDRQFARGLWGDGIITYTDFLGFIGPGSIPGPLQAIVNTLADDNTGAPTPRKDAIGFMTGSKTYQYTHPLVEVLRQAMAATDPKWTVDYLRARWLVWATL